MIRHTSNPPQAEATNGYENQLRIRQPMISTPWDSLRDVALLELAQREYEGALIPRRLRRQIETLPSGRDDQQPEKILALLAALADLEIDASFAYVQPNELAAIRRERPSGPRRLPLALSAEQLLDRFHGAWAARAAGCALGKPVELMGMSVRPDVPGGRSAIRAYLEHRGDWPLDDYFRGVDAGDGLELISPGSQRDRIAYMEPDDDIHYTLIALHVLESKGPGFAWYDVADAWNTCLPNFAICTAEVVAVTNYLASTPRMTLAYGEQAIRPDPAWTRTHMNPYREWIGAQIRADGWGYACAGNPELAAELAWRDACWTHTANGIYGAMFFAAMIAASFVEDDPLSLIEIGLSEIPRTCRLAEAVNQAVAWFSDCRDPEEFMDRLEERYGDLHPAHTVNNALIVLMAIVYGEMDNHRSSCLAVTGGLDTDCNGATAGSITGAAAGYDSLDKRLIEALNDTIEPRVFGFRETRIRELAERQLQVFERTTQETRTPSRRCGHS